MMVSARACGIISLTDERRSCGYQATKRVNTHVLLENAGILCRFASLQTAELMSEFSGHTRD